MSVQGNGKPYTCPGLGDRVHTATLAYRYGHASADAVTIHLTADKMNRDKPESWLAILGLFPSNVLTIRGHPVEGLSNRDWVAYLKANGFTDAECYYYADLYGMHPAEDVFPLDISRYIKESPRLEPGKNLWADFQPMLPAGRYATVHWESGGDPLRDQRRVTYEMQQRIEERYRAEGLELVTVGGEAEQPLLRSSLRHVGCAMAHAECHAGIDSGPMHLAALYLPFDRLHIYSAGARSHHVRRWVANGAKLNRYAA